MNYFAHGRKFLDRPYFLAGTAVPDWLNVTDRKTRVRSKHALPFVQAADPRWAELAQGIVQHHFDDDWFHRSSAFQIAQANLSRDLKPLLPEEDGHRRGFLGHILVELLLDAGLIEDAPGELERYCQAIQEVDRDRVQTWVNAMAPRPAERLRLFVRPFVAEGFLRDYREDAKLTHRLNQVLHRVGLPALPAEFPQWLPAARAEVRRWQAELLTHVPD